MLFNSLEYALFLPIVFLLYWFMFDYAIKRCKYQLRYQNAFIVLASYIFYGWWDWRFLLLIAFTSLCSWGSGLLIGQASSQQKAKVWMWLNIVINLAILATFKYYDFFVTELCGLFNISTEGLLVKVILPVGISFYTFQALSYSIDVYRKKIEPTRDVIAFFAFISFFPQLVAGPIERATHLLPQFLQKRTFNYEQATDGMRQILWGLFKKIVIADNCATYVDQVFGTYTTQTGSTLLLAAVLFTFQIYGDFSGYSDIAIGAAKLFGIRLMRNFNNPYFSRDIAEFWRRWHISLTTWFRDYVYIPLGGSRPEIPTDCSNPEARKKFIILRNTFVIFLVSGLWHGANWTFLAWGTYHALLFLPLILLGANRKYTNQVAEGRILPTWCEVLQMFLTFALIVLGWIIFRAETITHAWEYILHMFTSNLAVIPYTTGIHSLFFNLVLLLITEWFLRNRQHGLDISHWHPVFRYSAYLGLLFLLFAFGGHSVNFIYFQF